MNEFNGGKGEAVAFGYTGDFGVKCMKQDGHVSIFNKRTADHCHALYLVAAPQIIGKGEAVAIIQEGPEQRWVSLLPASIGLPAGSKLYAAPQAECAPRAKERLWLMVADNFTRDEFEQAFVECAPRADLMQVANRVAAEFRDLASKLPNDVLAKLFAAPQAECAPRAECHIDKYSSRICENGTLSCDVEHPRADADTAGAKPIAWLIDPGAGSAKDRLQSIEPSEFQLAEINRRGGSVTPLVAAGAGNERADAEKDAALTDDDIRRIFMANGFTIKEGQSDLKPYVYAAARAILAANKEPQP